MVEFSVSGDSIASLVRATLGKLPCTIEPCQGQIKVDFSDLKDFRWKEGLFQFDRLFHLFEKTDGVHPHKSHLNLDAPISSKSLGLFLVQLGRFENLLRNENLLKEVFWSKPKGAIPTGLGENTQSKNILDQLYRDQFIVAEKKPMVLDFDLCVGPYLVSVDSEKNTVIDAASQISTIALGFGHPLKQAMVLRKELLDNESDLKNWDVANAFRRLLKAESHLSHVHFLNSGAEAVETAIRGCQTHYPKRRKILAFEGSFHGRTLLTLHCTFKPDNWLLNRGRKKNTRSYPERLPIMATRFFHFRYLGALSTGRCSGPC